MKAGELDRQIVIESATITNNHGEVTETWVTHATVWAKVSPFTKAEDFAANTIMNAQAAVFTIRYLGTVTQKMRIVFDNKAWYIRAIQIVGRNETMQITAEGGEIEGS